MIFYGIMGTIFKIDALDDESAQRLPKSRLGENSRSSPKCQGHLRVDSGWELGFSILGALGPPVGNTNEQCFKK